MLKIIGLIIFLVIFLIQLALQQKWKKWHDGRTRIHKWILRSLISFVVLGAVVSFVVSWIDSAELSRLTEKVSNLVTSNENLQKQLEKAINDVQTAARAVSLVGTLKPPYPRTNNSSAELGTGVGWDQSSQVFTIQMSQGTIFQPLGRHVPFSIGKDANGLLISAKVQSLDGKIVASLQDNEWVLNRDNYFLHGADRSAFEVIGDSSIPLLQVEYLDDNRIKFGGVFHLEENEISAIYPDFPVTPKDTNPRAVISLPAPIMIIGSGYQRSSKNISRAELRNKASEAGLKPWFDYSKARKLGIRKQAGSP